MIRSRVATILYALFLSLAIVAIVAVAAGMTVGVEVCRG